MALSGKKTVTTAGTAVQLGTQAVNAALAVRACSANTGKMYLGNLSEDIDSANGYELAAGEAVVFEFVANLADLWLDSSVNGEAVSWLILSA
jgi:hypothetical protein